MVIGIEADHANKMERTGVEEYCWQIIQELKKIIPSKERVVLYSRSPLRGELGVLSANWENKVLAWRSKKLWSQIRLSWELFRHPPDVFFAPGQLIPIWCPGNTIVMVHDSAFLAYPEAYNFWSRQYLKWMNNRIIIKAAAILTSTEFNKKELLKYYLVEENKIKVIPLGYDKTRFIPISCEEGIEKYFLAAPYIIFIGRLERKKNVARLVEAFNELKHGYSCEQKIRGLKLALVGKPGVGHKEIKEAIARSYYKKDIRILGWVEREELPHLLNAAEALVLPSFYEGFGLPVFESMACGCPVVAAAGSALSEVGGEAAVYVNPLDAKDIAEEVRKILFDGDDRKKRIAMGLEMMKKFSWEETARGVYNLIVAKQ